MLVENYDKVKELMAELDRCRKALEEWKDCFMVIPTKTGHLCDIDRIVMNSDCQHELNDQTEAFIRSCQIFYKKRIESIRKQIEFL